MRNKRLWAIVLATALTATSLAGCANTASTSVSPETQKSIDEMEQMAEALDNAGLSTHSDTSGKEETVYVIMDANGAKNETIVSEWLKNPEAASEMVDITGLSDIEVVKGGATYTQDADGQMRWNTEGGDVYYQGKTDKELPVDVKVSYELDGKPVQAEALKDVTGHVKIKYDYENKISKVMDIGGEQVSIYQPFTIITGLLLDDDKTSNIKVSDGKVINSGSYTAVFGVAMPGLSESIGLDKLKEENDADIDIPESVTIEADVHDFTMPMAMTMATNDAISTLKLGENSDKIDELKEKSDELTDGMDELMDGTAELDDGAHELKDGTDELRDGVAELDDGATELNDGAQELLDGSVELRDGAKKLYDGSQELFEGSSKLSDGTSQLSEKTPELQEGVKALRDGAISLNKGLTQITANNDALNKGAGDLVTGIGQLDAGASSLQSGISDMQTQITSAIETQIIGALQGMGTELGDKLTKASSGIKLAKSMINDIIAGSQENLGEVYTNRETMLTLKGKLEALQGQTEAVYSKAMIVDDQAKAAKEEARELDRILDGDDESYSVDEAISYLSKLNSEAEEPDPGLEKVIKTLKNVEGISDDIDETVDKIVDASNSACDLSSTAGSMAENASGLSTDAAVIAQQSEEILADTQDLTTKLTNVKGQLEVVAGVLGTISEQLDSGVTEITAKLTGAIASIKAGFINEDSAVQQGFAKLSAGAGQLKAGTGSALTGAQTLQGGIKAYTDGVSAAQAGSLQLRKGTEKLYGNVPTLVKGVQDLNSGAVTLKNGICTLRDGAGELYDGTEELHDGVVELKDGTQELKDGTTELRDGVDELCDGVGELVDGTGKLKDGVIELNDEGISKITDLIGNDIENYYDRIQAVKDFSKEYTTFSGSCANTEGTVKFIYKTDGVK